MSVPKRKRRLKADLSRRLSLKQRHIGLSDFGDEIIKLKDVIESGEFHKFIEELQALQKWQSTKMLRNARTRLMEKANLYLRRSLNATGKDWSYWGDGAL